MKPFIVAAYRDVTKKEADDGKEPQWLNFESGPFERVFAKDETDAKLKAAALLSGLKDAVRLEVVVLPLR